MEPATTNGAEAFHADFNAQFNSSHPNIFASISILQQVQAKTYLKLNSVKHMESNYIRPKRIELKEKRMMAWQEVLNGERTVSPYLLYMGSLNANFIIQG
ncbi:Chalcone synthase RJ5 [Frankliniella fusca]|uniref:Chalcone synthase RJ5 n=1 Tax=Frankliniella fusca TaxID=407009 RepID=A0AAE1HAX1_9NEOP|nr:Chalcone synthase RJ5 [Frankliniella fusca]